MVAQQHLARQAGYRVDQTRIDDALEYLRNDGKSPDQSRPYYSDTLIADYADILVQNGDALVNENACGAWWYYDQALLQVPGYEPAVKGWDYAKENCDQSGPVPPEGYGPPA